MKIFKFENGYLLNPKKIPHVVNNAFPLKIFLYLGVYLPFLFLQLLYTTEAHAQNHQHEILDELVKNHRWSAIIQHIEQGKLLNKNKDNPAVEHYYNYLLSEAYLGKGNVPQAKSFIHKGLKFVEANPDSLLFYRMYVTYSKILNREGRFEELHQYLAPAMSFALRENNLLLLHDCHLILGGQSLQNGQLRDALQSYKSAKKISLSNHQTFNIHLDDLNISLAFCFMQKLDSAKVYLTQTITAASTLKDSSILAAAYNVLGYYYLLNNDRKKWKDNVIVSMNIAEKIQHPDLIAMSYSQLMEFSLSEKDYNEAIKMGKKAYMAIPKTTSPLFHAHIDSLMYETYKGIGDFITALQYFEKYYKNKTNILSIEQSEKLESIRSDFKLKENNLRFINQALELENAKKQRIILLITNFLLLIIIVAGYYFRKNRKILHSTLYQKEKVTALLFNHHKIETASRKPDIKNDYPDVDLKKTNPEGTGEVKKELYEQLIQAIEHQKLYLNPNLDINMIVTILGTNKFYLYQAISKNTTENFRNIVNRYRVEEVKRRIELIVKEKSNRNIESIHNDAGFNSPSSYYRIFRQLTGLTPKEYMHEYIQDQKTLND